MNYFACTVLVLIAVLFVPSLLASPANIKDTKYRLAFNSFVHKYQRQYVTPAEKEMRYRIFKNNFEYIQNFNKQNNGVVLGVNNFADLTNEEFRQKYNGYNVATNINKEHKTKETFGPGAASCPAGNSSGDYTTSCDWRNAGVVTGIKNQGQCGSCWAFSTTGSVEGAHALSTSTLVSLSEQDLVDCSDAEGNEGCNGGLMDQAFEYIIKNKGIDTEASYPYVGVDEKCTFKAANVGATISSYQDIPTGNETALALAVQTVGPVSVAIDASGMSFQFYKSGVYYDVFCSSKNLDHGVLAVGLGTYHDFLGTKDYYVVKNSWGTDWGQDGYIFMSRNRDNNCGIATSASYPIV